MPVPPTCNVYSPKVTRSRNTTSCSADFVIIAPEIKNLKIDKLPKTLRSGFN